MYYPEYNNHASMYDQHSMAAAMAQQQQQQQQQYQMNTAYAQQYHHQQQQQHQQQEQINAAFQQQQMTNGSNMIQQQIVAASAPEYPQHSTRSQAITLPRSGPNQHHFNISLNPEQQISVAVSGGPSTQVTIATDESAHVLARESSAKSIHQSQEHLHASVIETVEEQEEHAEEHKFEKHSEVKFSTDERAIAAAQIPTMSVGHSMHEIRSDQFQNMMAPAQMPVQMPAQMPAQIPAQMPAQMPAQLQTQMSIGHNMSEMSMSDQMNGMMAAAQQGMYMQQQVQPPPPPPPQAAPAYRMPPRMPLPIIPLSEPVTGPPMGASMPNISYSHSPQTPPIMTQQPTFAAQSMVSQATLQQTAPAMVVPQPIPATTTAYAYVPQTASFGHSATVAAGHTMMSRPMAAAPTVLMAPTMATMGSTPNLLMPQTATLVRHHWAGSSGHLHTEQHYHTHFHNELHCHNDTRLFRRRQPHGLRLRLF